MLPELLGTKHDNKANPDPFLNLLMTCLAVEENWSEMKASSSSHPMTSKIYAQCVDLKAKQDINIKRIKT